MLEQNKGIVWNADFFTLTKNVYLNRTKKIILLQIHKNVDYALQWILASEMRNKMYPVQHIELF